MSFGAVVVEKREGRYVRQVRVSLWFGLSTAALSPAPVWKATGHHPEYVSLSPFGMVVSWNWLKPEGPVKSLALKGVATAEPMIAVAKAVNGSVNILVVGCVSALAATPGPFIRTGEGHRRYRRRSDPRILAFDIRFSPPGCSTAHVGHHTRPINSRATLLSYVPSATADIILTSGPSSPPILSCMKGEISSPNGTVPICGE